MYEHTLCAANLTVGIIGAKKVSSMLLGESDRFVLASREHSLEPGASEYSTGVDRILACSNSLLVRNRSVMSGRERQKRDAETILKRVQDMVQHDKNLRFPVGIGNNNNKNPTQPPFTKGRSKREIAAPPSRKASEARKDK